MTSLNLANPAEVDDDPNWDPNEPNPRFYDNPLEVSLILSVCLPDTVTLGTSGSASWDRFVESFLAIFYGPDLPQGAS